MCTFASAFKATRCSAVGSVPGLGPGCRRFESCHLDFLKKPLIHHESAAFLLLFFQMLGSFDAEDIEERGHNGHHCHIEDAITYMLLGCHIDIPSEPAKEPINSMASSVGL